MKEYKVVVMGSGGVGKSCLTVQFVSGTFLETYDPTIEDFYRKEIEMDNAPCVIEILDTAGTEQFASMRDLYIKNGQGFVLVYSITNAQSFVDIQPLREKIFQLKGARNSALVLVGNKCDMINERSVTQRDAAYLAAEWVCPFYESSAKTRVNVNNVFLEVVKVINQMKLDKSGTCCSLM